MKIQNPVLTGFHADPSMIRVGDTYYIANSTFEWFPGVRVHESRDMVHWKYTTSILDRVELLDMKGDPCSGGSRTFPTRTASSGWSTPMSRWWKARSKICATT